MRFTAVQWKHGRRDVPPETLVMRKGEPSGASQRVGFRRESKALDRANPVGFDVSLLSGQSIVADRINLSTRLVLLGVSRYERQFVTPREMHESGKLEVTSGARRLLLGKFVS